MAADPSQAAGNPANGSGGVLRGAQARAKFAVPSDHEKLVQWLEAKRDMGKTAFPLSQMKLNMAFMLGYQWVTWDHRMRNYRRPTIDIQDPNTPVRIHSNKIAGIGERVIAKLTKDAPVPETRPVSNDDNDVSAARVGTRILASECDRLEWKPRLQKFLFWPWVLGHGYKYIWWDPDAGEHVGELAEYDDDEDPNIFEGNVCMEDVPAFELTVDPAAREMADAKWCVRTTTMTTEAAWERWDIGLEGGAVRNLAQEVHALGAEDPARPDAEWCNIHQFWMRPCKAAPKGKVITWSGQTIIENKPFPYEHGMLPFVQCNMLPGIGTREGRTPVNDLIPLQTDYNDTLSREATIRRQLTPKLIAAVGQIDPQRVTSRVEVLQYMPGVSSTPPTLETPNAAWAQQFEMGMDRDEKDMNDRAGMNEASKGEAASTAPAAGILASQEADDTKLSISATELAQFIANVGRHILLLCKQYWTEERTVRVWSEENMLDAFRYSAADIDERLDVHVSSESALPRSKAARTQLILELQARFPDLFDPQTLMNMLDLPGVDLMTRSLDIDTRKAYRMLSQLLLDNDPPSVKPYDNHVVHLKVLNDFRKSIDYEKLPIEDQARIDARCAVHEMLVLRQMGVKVPTPTATADPEAMAQAELAGMGPAGPVGGPTQPPQPGAPGQGTPPAPASTADMAGIGGAGNPGRIPNMPVDQQAASMGG